MAYAIIARTTAGVQTEVTNRKSSLTNESYDSVLERTGKQKGNESLSENRD